MTKLQEKTTTLNKMAEIIVNLQSEDQDTMCLAKYKCSEMNLPQEVTIQQVEYEIGQTQKQLDNKFDEYEEALKRLEDYVQLLTENKNVSIRYCDNILGY